MTIKAPEPALLPIPNIDTWETRAVMKKTAEAHRYLAELKGVAKTIPNEGILINTLVLQEAKHSSEIENIITTHDELFRAELDRSSVANPATKEVQNYSSALKLGFSQVRKYKMIRLKDILDIQETLENNRAGLRKLPGTDLKNAATGDVIYTPPQHPDDIVALMDNLITYINDPSICDADELVKMAIIHHQFESIHPFYDDNGRTGRILSMLYLVSTDLLEIPVLYLSRYLIHSKAEYYRQLQAVRETGDWESWILYMLQGIVETAKGTVLLINQIKQLMTHYKNELRTHAPKIYRQELLNNLFYHPYTKIEFIVQELGITRLTAAKYLDQLVDIGLLRKEKIGRSNFYINEPLIQLFTEHS